MSLIDGYANEIAIVTDGNRVKQIIINLLSNAIKYTVQGYVRIYVLVEENKVESSGGGGGFVKIKVEDSGVGMSNQQKARLFQPFTKIKSNRQLNKEGVGLGLAVSKNIAIALSGNIEVTSAQGKGSTFILKLPLT